MTDTADTAPTRASIETRCSHGTEYNVECIECQIVWYQDCLQDAARRVISCTDMIKKLERQKTSKGNAR